MSDDVVEGLRETLQEPELLSLKFLHNITETGGEPSEMKPNVSPKPNISSSPDAPPKSNISSFPDVPPKPNISSFPDVSSASTNFYSPTVSSIISDLKSTDFSSLHPESHLTILGPPTLQKLTVELQDMREELELLKTQHKKEIKLLMNELDEEKKMRLSLQVEVEHLKKHMSK